MSDYSKQADAENERKITALLQELPQFAKLYFDDARRSKLPRTRLGYARDLAHFFGWLQSTAGFRGMDLRTAPPTILERLTFEDFEEYKSTMEYSSRTDARGRPLLAENTTLARRLSALRSFMAFYYKIGAIKTNPAMYVSMPKIASREIIALDAEDVDLIMQTAHSTAGLTKNQIVRRKLTEKRDIAILMTLLGTGIRVSELVGLDTKSVDFRNGMITVTLKGGNDGHSYFGAEVESALRDYVENGRPRLKPAVDDDALFLSVRHQRMTVRAVELLVKDYTERAGIANADRITPHKLRATYGTQLYERSGDIKLVASTLHHKSIETTSKHYVKDSEETHDKVVRYTDELFRKD
jgi:integrase/recombinase XerC